MKKRDTVAGVAVRSREGRREVLAARRLPGGAMGGRWEFPGGKVREGEGDAGALRREFMEELGVPAEAGALIGEDTFVHGDTEFTLRVYRVSLPSTDFTLTAHSEYRWAAPEELEGLDLADSDRLLLPAILKALE
jgi:8-oxo-dGTP diphosphatase